MSVQVMSWVHHTQNTITRAIGPQKLLRAMLNPDNYARWLEFHGNTLHNIDKRKKGGITVNGNKVVTGSQVRRSSGD